jgi:hypothetical protein
LGAFSYPAQELVCLRNLDEAQVAGLILVDIGVVLQMNGTSKIWSEKKSQVKCMM